MVKGIGASSGIAIGKAFVLPAWEYELPEGSADAEDIAFEFEKLYDGIRLSKSELEIIKRDIIELIGEKESGIFDAHLAILDDPVFMHEIEEIMQRQSKAAVVAVKEAIDKFVGMFDLLDDEYMKERSADLKDVGGRLLKHLLGDFNEEVAPPPDAPYILVARELAPSQLAGLDPARVPGIVTMLGGATSHAAIMARAMGIPFVLGLEGKLPKSIQTGDQLIADGDTGEIFSNPDAATIACYEERRKRLVQMTEELQEVADVPPVTRDGKRLELKANISTIKELEQALRNGAAGVGLFRTEFIFLDRSSLPSEDEQYGIYRQAAEALEGRSLIIRTLDIGGDKCPGFVTLPPEENPALGYRAIRVLLDRTDMFKTQLKAILRAAYHGNVKIMYPMISSPEEIHAANRVLEQAKAELRSEGIPFRADIEVGIMIEVPAAAIISDLLAQEVHFFSIGTNDLIQYILAVDRMSETVAHLYEPCHPSVLRLLLQTVESAKRHGIPVGVCGEMAGDSLALPLWLGLGVDDLSMSVKSLLQVKNKLIRCTQEAAAQLFERAVRAKTAAEIRRLLDEWHAGFSMEQADQEMTGIVPKQPEGIG